MARAGDPEGRGAHRSARLAWMLVAAALLTVRAAVAQAPGPQPQPSLTPADVVRIQLEAIRANDAQDGGIAIAYRFASPENQNSTGPLERFAAMIKQGAYAMMLRYTAALYGPVTVAGRRAVQRVTLSAPGQTPVTYVFHLVRHEGSGPLHECWLTDGVEVVEFRGSQA